MTWFTNESCVFCDRRCKLFREAAVRQEDALEKGDYAAWHRYTTDQIEESGEHEVLNWFCLLGAMEALGRKPDKATFLETWAFVSPVVFAYYRA